ncbi:MAG: sulfite exporter TauE/SafE family protein [Pseudomonadota bacterium]
MAGELLLSLIVPLLVAGIVAGLIAGLLGVGGGIVLVPILSLVLARAGVADRVSMHIAVATSLAVIVATSMLSARAHAQQGAVQWAVIKRWGPFIALGAFVGAILARWLDGDVMRVLFAVLATVVGLRMLMSLPARTTHWQPSASVQRSLATLIGTFSSWIGIGGGSFSVPMLTRMGFSVHRAVGSSAMLGLFIAVPATFGYIVAGRRIPDLPKYAAGFVHLPSVLIIILAASITTRLGASLAHKLPQATLKRVFGAFLIVAAARMTWRVMH